MKIEIYIDADAINAKWEDEFELSMKLRWGIKPKNVDTGENISEEFSTDNYNFYFNLFGDTYDRKDGRGSGTQDFILPISKYKGRDSYMPQTLKMIEHLLIRIGRYSKGLELKFAKYMEEFFKIVDIKLSDLINNLHLLTASFAQVVEIPSKVYATMEKVYKIEIK